MSQPFKESTVSEVPEKYKTDYEEIISRDFFKKKDSYYHENYVLKNKSNFLRRYRNSLIKTKILKLKSVSKVLDVGCGPAILYPELLERCDSYHAIDIVESNLKKIKENNKSKKIKLIKSDLNEYRYEVNSYDLIICSGSIEYTKRPKQIICELIKSLKLNGTLILSLPNKNSPYRLWSESFYKAFRYVRDKILGKYEKPYNRMLFTENYISNIFKSEVKDPLISFDYFGLKILLQPLDIIFNNLDYKIVNFFIKNPSNMLNKLSSEFIVSFKK